ncbi:MAG: alpha-ketoglutarate-dependent dioxygenase AlkB [Tatlockia sp.]|nr:alpha-ketoglutarate-dependent dioxygenase AlkB [Tatlockia sp.]
MRVQVKSILLAGFSYHAEFVSAEEEQLLIRQFRTLNWQNIIMYKKIAKRRVVHFGLDYSYSNRKVKSTVSPPAFLEPIIARSAQLLLLKPTELEEILITEYSPGAGIGWHRDAPVFDKIIGISLANPCFIKFRLKSDIKTQFKVDLEPRSAYILSSSIREDWEHSIAPVKHIRYSLTFRNLK